MVTFFTIIYVLVAFVMVLAILLQSGKGGGLGSALGGGASQSVFGGGGSADFMSRLTQFCAGAFMVLAMYLAYASAHSGSSFLEENSEEDALAKQMVEEDGDVNYETIGPRPQKLPTAEEAAKLQAAAAGKGETPASISGLEPEPTPEPEPVAPTGDAAAAPSGDAAAPSGDAAAAPSGDAEAEAPAADEADAPAAE